MNTPATEAPTEHSHVMGGSTAAQRVNCPGSYLAEKDAPEKPESEFAMQGTVFHAAMEILVTADPVDPDAADILLAELVGQDLGFGEKWTITEDQIDSKLRPALIAWLEIVTEWELDDWFIEQRVSLEAVVPGAFGTADIIAIDTAKRLHILDWKFGDGVPVPVEGNMGLGFYAAGALYDEDPELVEFCTDINGVVLHIVQPRVGDSEVRHVWETSETWIESFIDQAAGAMDKAMKPGAPLKAGSWCRWCSAKVTCPVQQKMASEALSKAPETMTAVELADALHKADLLKSWIADVYTLAQTELEGGAAVPGYKLVQKQPRRVWKDPDAAEATMKKRKVKVADMYNRKLKSPTQIQKSVPDLYKKTLKSHVIMHSSGLTIVTDDDKREAVTNSMELLANAMEKTGNSEQKH